MKRILAAGLILLLIFAAFASAETAQEVVEDAAVEAIEAPAADEEETAAEEREPEGRLAGLIIGIDPGHQEHANNEKETIAPNSKEKKAKVSSGTRGSSTKVPEYVVNLDVALKLRDALEALGAKVVMTRETHDVNISNQERAAVMNDANVDLALRIHCNGVNNHSSRGIGLYVRKTGTRKEECAAAAKIILDEMCASTGAKKGGVYYRDTYTMNNWCVVPCILVEMGFMTNYEEDKKLNDPAYQDLLVEGMVNGVCKYFER